MVALRAAPVFAATRYSTEPLPLPDAPDVIVSQLAFPVAVQAQPDPAVTLIVPVDPSEPTLTLVGEMVNTHWTGGGGVGDGVGAGGAGSGAGAGVGIGSGTGVAPACWIVTVSGPIVTTPARGVVAVFAPTVSVSVVDRLPLAFAGSTIQAAWLVAAQAQPLSVSTATLTSPPFAETAVFASVTL
jgi:hypothetical protein